jgi:glycerol-3-phosphate dehydrogenase (NAD(P)+)
MIALLGAGNIATALALILGKRAKRVALYAIEAEVAQSINKNHQNTKYLPGHILPASVFATDDMHEALRGARFVFMAVPSHAVAEVLSAARPHLEPDTIIVSITKGVDPETFNPLILQQIELMPRDCKKNLVLLGGPAIANELASGQVTALIAASKNRAAREAVRQLFSSTHVRISLSEDLVGVGLCSALKNAYAIALGLCDGLEVSTNTKAFIYTTALQEMGELVIAAGGQQETVFGIAGAGDLFVSGNSFHGRNRLYGQKLVTSTTKDPQKLGITTAEGINTTITAIKLAKQKKLKTPLLQTIYECLNKQSRFSTPFERYLRGRN